MTTIVSGTQTVINKPGVARRAAEPVRRGGENRESRESAGGSLEGLQVPDWSTLVGGIRAGDPDAMAELYRVFAKGIRYYLLRNLGPAELDDKVHDCFVIVTQAIQHGDLREPERLMGYVRTVVKRQIAASIDLAVQQRNSRVDYDESMFLSSDWRDNPEGRVMARQQAEIARRVLNGISRRDRDILHRFYVLEQSQEQICADLGLSYNQFRLLKSRAKARFGELGRRVAEGNGSRLRKNL